MTLLNDVLNDARRYLEEREITDADSDSGWLIADILGLHRAELFCYPKRPVSDSEQQRIAGFLKRRGLGEPVQYIIGSTTFFNSEILVGPGVLIPRPETEVLVEIGLRLYEGKGDILDVCTGSGAIVFALAAELPGCPALVGTDISKAALSWAQKNLGRIRDKRLAFLEGNLFEPVGGRKFNLITANPPYVSASEYNELPSNIRDHEPREALHSALGGLQVFTSIADEGRRHLNRGGWLVCEIGEAQGRRALEICGASAWRNCEVVKDLNGKDRIVIAQN